MDVKKLTPDEFRGYIQSRGYRCAAIYNTTEQRMDGVNARVMGYEMIGPRRNKGIITPDANGMLSSLTVTLWCDSVDYANAKIMQRQLLEMRV